MTPYASGTGWELLHGDCIEVMRGMAEASVDAIVCDPPYGLEFMGKEWDRLWNDRTNGEDNRKPIDANGKSTGLSRWSIARPDAYVAGAEMQAWHEAWAREALRVLKPGGHLLAMGGSRTHHRLFCAIEDAGFECRDTIVWLFGSGFPKSRSLRDIERPELGTALKPAAEFICMARKPLAEGTVAANVLAWGTGGINVDACRIAHSEECRPMAAQPAGDLVYRQAGRHEATTDLKPSGRWPANVCLDEEAAALLDEQAGVRRAGAFPKVNNGRTMWAGSGGGLNGVERECRTDLDTGGASRFFFTAKASRSERGKANNHPTVKPVALMRWLCRLITPPGVRILDPFAGSGSTGVAAIAEGFRFIGIEKESEYCEMARERLAGVHPRLPGLDLP